MLMYNTFIFDFDFTLADASPGIIESVNYALTQMSLEPKDSASIKKTIGMTLDDIFHTLTGMQNEDMSVQFFNYFKSRADQIMVNNTELFSDTVEVLSNIKAKGYKTAIVTTKMRYRVNDILKKFAINHLIDLVVGFDDVEKAKPDPEGLYKAVELLGVEKKNVLYTGDSIIDAKAAAAAEIDFAAVLTGTTAREEFEKLPNVVIAGSLTEAISI